MTNRFQQQNIGGLNHFNSNNYGYIDVENVEGLDRYIDAKVSNAVFGNIVTSSALISTNNTIPRFDGITGSILKESGVIISDIDEISGINALTSIHINSSNINDVTGGSALYITTGVNGVVQLTKDTYKGIQDAVLTLNIDGTLQKSNIVSSAIATIDDTSTSSSTTWSSSKVSAEISAGGNAPIIDWDAIPASMSSLLLPANSWDYYINEEVPHNITINAIRVSFGTISSDSNRMAIYRGNDLSSILVGQSIVFNSSTLTNPWANFPIIAETGQSLSFVKGEKIVVGFSSSGTTNRIRGLTITGEVSLGWFNTTDSVSSGFPVNPRSKGGSLTTPFCFRLIAG